MGLKVSVITTCLNAEKTIADNVRSVNCQTYGNIEHVIIDGLSSDGTLSEIIRTSTRQPIIFSERDSGALEAFQKGVNRATGEIIGFLNSDDFFLDSGVVEQIAKIFEDPSVDACYANVVYVDRVNSKKVKRFWRLGPYRTGALAFGWAPAHPTFYVRKKIFEVIGNFSDNFPLQSDFEFAARFFLSGRFVAVYVDKTWVAMRTGGISNRSMRGIFRQNIENLRALRLNGMRVGLSYVLLRIISRFPQYLYAVTYKRWRH